jgi:hypothetical protein
LVRGDVAVGLEWPRLDPAIRADLIGVVRDGKVETRLTRRANALLLLDDGMSCAAIAKVLVNGYQDPRIDGGRSRSTHASSP